MFHLRSVVQKTVADDLVHAPAESPPPQQNAVETGRPPLQTINGSNGSVGSLGSIHSSIAGSIGGARGASSDTLANQVVDSGPWSVVSTLIPSGSGKSLPLYFGECARGP